LRILESATAVALVFAPEKAQEFLDDLGVDVVKTAKNMNLHSPDAAAKFKEIFNGNIH